MTAIELRALDAIGLALTAVDMSEYGISAVSVYKRMLDSTDPHGSVGAFFHSWMPVEGPQIGTWEPAIARYRYAVQSYLKLAERESGEEQNAAFTKKIRSTLYRDDDLRLSLGSLRDGDTPPIERALRWGIEQTQYSEASITGGFVYLSQTEFYFETEVVA